MLGKILLVSEKSTINLALQGGGSHGAYTWGVLDALLKDQRFSFENISGTSSGAINATLLASGYLQNKEEGARNVLREFWENIPGNSNSSSWLNSANTLSIPFSLVKNEVSKYFRTKNQQPPVNQLQAILEKNIDFELLSKYSPFGLYITATYANSGKKRIFTTSEISCQALLASACLPGIFPTVYIKDEPYWDGGFCANPAILPLINHAKYQDILIVMLQPLQYSNLPSNTFSTSNRINRLVLNSTFLSEMQMIAQIQNIPKTTPKPSELEKRIFNTRFHLIEAHRQLAELSITTMLNPNKKLISKLFDYGKESCRQWIDKNIAKIGKSSSININNAFR